MAGAIFGAVQLSLFVVFGEVALELHNQFSWQVQYLVQFNSHFPWQAQYLVNLEW